jgi:type III pantothenate kinase
LAGRISRELGGDVTIVATGGLGGLFTGLCERISKYEPMLTLDGLRRAFESAKTH